MEFQAVKVLSIEASKIFFLIVILITISAISLGTGELSIAPDKVFYYLKDSGSMEYQVLRNIRIPRTILAIATGGSLGLSGIILQGIFRNPLVE